MDGTTWMSTEDILLSDEAEAVPPWGLFWGSEGLCGGCIQLAGYERAVGFWAISGDRPEEGTLLLLNLPLGEALPSQDALSRMQLGIAPACISFGLAYRLCHTCWLQSL